MKATYQTQHNLGEVISEALMGALIISLSLAATVVALLMVVG